VSPRFSLSDVFLRTQTDQRLAALAADGHQLAFATLVERHRAGLLGTAGRLVGPQRSEDVVQQALLRAWRSLAAGTEVSHVRGWLHQIVRNTAYSESAGDRGPTDPLPAELADPRSLAGALEQRMVAHDLLEHLAALPERQRTALLKTELEGHSRQQIAAELGLSEGAVRQLVHRARNGVRVAMTAATPYPLAAWAARRGAGPSLAERLASLTGAAGSGRPGAIEGLAAGSAAGGDVLVKGAAALLAAGALGGGLAWQSTTGHPRHGQRHHAATLAASRPPAEGAGANGSGALGTATATAASDARHAPRGAERRLPAIQPRAADKRRSAVRGLDGPRDGGGDRVGSRSHDSGSSASDRAGGGDARAPSSSGSDRGLSQPPEGGSGPTATDHSSSERSAIQSGSSAPTLPDALSPAPATAVSDSGASRPGD